ncbi:MAG TPA: NUDIX hydrolase [Dictyobacter sp.]|jgi:ADP-ribose pyrophosphatase YjhB (NUDIX family)|nr:NUDIX hydrolase [Dictyobacter sp.]
MNTPRTMITFKQGNSKFTYRIGGIVIHNRHVLFQRATLDPNDLFWFLPGGRAELGESAEETLKREMQEELGEAIQIQRLLYIVENFFVHTTVHHELGMYFLMALPTDSYLLQTPGPYVRDDENGLPMIFEWLPIDHLSQLAVRPAFLRNSLQSLSIQTTHIVQMDSSDNEGMPVI